MEYELGRVTRHPIRLAFSEWLCVIRTWLYCRKEGWSANEWWGVYEKGTERPIAKFGCLPGSKSRASEYLLALQRRDAA